MANKVPLITPIILSGGSGSRLWPLSRKAYPKQFLRLNSEQSLFQQTVARVTGAGYTAPVVVTNADHQFLVQEQLQELGIDDAEIILEPAARNTAPAMGLACAFLADKHPDVPVLMLPCDHIIKDFASFNETAQKAVSKLNKGGLVTFGVEPTRPETGYGYIEASVREDEGIHPAVRFVEKPNQNTAESYLESGNFYWNAGILLATPKTMLKELAKHAPKIAKACQKTVETKELIRGSWHFNPSAFATCPDDSLDYALLEKSKNVFVAPYSGHWNDVGSFHALWEELPKDASGNANHGEVLNYGSNNSLIWAENAVVGTIGVNNLAIIQTPDALLVADRSRVQNVKQLYQQLQESQHNLVTHNQRLYAPWGWLEVIAHGPGFQTQQICLNPGATLPVQRFTLCNSHWHCLAGQVLFTRGADAFPLPPGQAAAVPVSEPLSIENESTQEPASLLVVVSHEQIEDSREPVPVEYLQTGQEGENPLELRPNLHDKHYVGPMKEYPMREALKKTIRNTPLYEPLLLGKRWLASWAHLVKWQLGGKPAPAPHRIKVSALKELAQTYNPGAFVETGTFMGDTTNAMKSYFNQLFTIELDDSLHQQAMKRFAKQSHITCIRGDSGEQLAALLPKLEQPTLFWLDGHYSGGITARGSKETPVVEELQAILNHKIKNHVILIDDARCFDGTHDYPTLDEVAEMVANAESPYTMSVQHDIIRITPVTAAS